MMKAAQITFLGLFGLNFLACDAGFDPGTEAVVRINNRSLSVQDLETKMNQLRGIPGKDFSSLDVRRELLSEMINEELLFQAAQKDGFIEKSAHLRREIAREYLRAKVGRESLNFSEEELKKKYAEGLGKKESIRASHILIKAKKPEDPTSEVAAEKKAKGLLDQIRKEGDFTKLAKAHSQDASNKDRGGDLGFFTREQMVPPFSQAAFALKKPGDVSDVVKTQFGYHIVKLTGDKRGFKRNRKALVWKLRQEKRKSLADQLFKDLRSRASVKIDDTLVMKARTPGETERETRKQAMEKR